jgi:hypothetical protein
MWPRCYVAALFHAPNLGQPLPTGAGRVRPACAAGSTESRCWPVNAIMVTNGHYPKRRKLRVLLNTDQGYDGYSILDATQFQNTKGSGCGRCPVLHFC